MRILLFFALLLPALAPAQTCLCCKKLEKGQTAYDQGDYSTALARWQEGLKLSDAANCPELAGLIKKAEGKIAAAKKAALERERAATAAKQSKEMQAAAWRAADDSYWDALKDGTIADCDKYFAKYPKGRHSTEAQNRKNSLSQKAVIPNPQKSQLDEILTLEKLVEDYPNSRYTDEALFQIGEIYFSLEKYDRAVPPFRRIITDFRGKSALVNQALLMLGLISVNQGSSTSAINYYKQVFANNPEMDEATSALAALREIYKDLNRPDEYYAFVESVPGNGNVSGLSKDNTFYEFAEAQSNRSHHQQAIEGFTSYLETYPAGLNILNAYFLRGESYVALKQYGKALKDYDAVIAMGNTKIYLKAIEKAALLSLNITKDHTRAFEYAQKWEKATTEEPSRINAQIVALKASYELKDPALTVAYSQRIKDSRRASQDQMAIANFYAGKMAYDKGDFNNAYSLLKAVTNNTSGEIMPEAYHYLGQILYRQKKYLEAEELITVANNASAGYDEWIAKNLILLSDLYADQGDKDSAYAALEAVIDNYVGDNKDIIPQAEQQYTKLSGHGYKQDDATTKKNSKTLLDLDEGN